MRNCNSPNPPLPRTKRYAHSELVNGYRAMKEIRRSLGRIEGKLDLIVPRVANHQDRLLVVEKKQARFGGMLAVVSLLVAGAFGWMWK